MSRKESLNVIKHYCPLMLSSLITLLPDEASEEESLLWSNLIDATTNIFRYAAFANRRVSPQDISWEEVLKELYLSADMLWEQVRPDADDDVMTLREMLERFFENVEFEEVEATEDNGDAE